MQRDIGNEIIVAIIVVGVLAFALTFGIILSLSNIGTNNQSAAQSNVATELSTIETEIVTEEATELDSSTMAAQANTDAPTVTSTVRPSSTPAPTETPSRMPTATATRTSTERPTLTATRQPTPTHTATPVPSATLTRTPSSTPTTPPATSTSTLTRTPTLTLTRTATIVPTPAQTNTPVVCIAPFGWLVYTVQPGNTLANIAEASSTTVTELRAANCLQDTASVRIGDSLYVPRLPLFVTPLPTARPDAVLVAQGCTSPGTVITSPVSGQPVTGTILIRGTAYAEDFAYYRIEARRDTSETYNFLLRSDKTVVNGNLGIIDSRSLSAGLNWIRVSVVDTAGNVTITPCAIPVIVQ
jgi:LysM repeat protein